MLLQPFYFVDAEVVLIFCCPQKFYHMQCWSHFDSLLQNILCVTNYLLLTTTLVDFRVIFMEIVHISVTKNDKFIDFRVTSKFFKKIIKIS